MLLHPATGFAARDAALAVLVECAQRDGGTWMVGLAGVLLSSPAANNRASRTASRRSVLTRSVGRFGINAGVVTRRSIPSSRAARASVNPVGPAKITLCTMVGTSHDWGIRPEGPPSDRSVPAHFMRGVPTGQHLLNQSATGPPPP
jgi:hypothetical protein